MNQSLFNRIALLGLAFSALLLFAVRTSATEISGTISSTLMITDNSELVGDVTCAVSSAPCIVIGASHITLELNGFSMTGQADPKTACSGAAVGSERGIMVDTQTGVAIRGPGLIQFFRGAGIFINNSTGVKVKGVTLSTNCLSGILVGGGSDHQFIGNVSIRNGNGSNPCGGI
jgi:hypothetical protein